MSACCVLSVGRSGLYRYHRNKFALISLLSSKKTGKTGDIFLRRKLPEGKILGTLSIPLLGKTNRNQRKKQEHKSQKITFRTKQSSIITALLLYHWLRELHVADFHKLGVDKSGRVWGTCFSTVHVELAIVLPWFLLCVLNASASCRVPSNAHGLVLPASCRLASFPSLLGPRFAVYQSVFRGRKTTRRDEQPAECFRSPLRVICNSSKTVLFTPLPYLCTTELVPWKAMRTSFGDVDMSKRTVHLKWRSKALDEAPVSGTVQFSWKDQGWGNQKGELFLMLMSSGGEEKASYNLPGHISPHEWEDVKVDLVATDPVLAEAAAGCWYQVKAECGSGNGHELYVKDFLLRLVGEY